MSNHIAPEPSKIGRMVMPALFVLIACVPIVYYGFQGEVARWTAAKAEIAYDAGQHAEAIDLLESAIEKAPDDNSLKLRLAEKWYKHDRAADALELIESVITSGANQERAVRQKAECLVYLGRAEEALATLKQISAYRATIDEDFDQISQLNELAYFRALAGRELDAARDNIDLAIKYTQIGSRFGESYPLPLLDQTLIAAVMVAREMGDSQSLLKTVNDRVLWHSEQLEELEYESSEFIYSSLIDSFPISGPLKDNTERIQAVKLSVRNCLATLLSVRGLINQDLGEPEKTVADRQRVARLGYDSETLIAAIPENWTLMTMMLNGSMILDTRAMVEQAITPGSGSALKDLDVAISAMEILIQSNDGKLQNTVQYYRNSPLKISLLKRHQAVIRKHRAELFVRRGNIEDAENDFLEIEKLGYRRNQMLF